MWGLLVNGPPFHVGVMKKKRRCRVPLKDESGSRIAFKESENGNFDIAVIKGSKILVFEIPPDVWAEITAKGYIDLVEE